MAIEEPVNAAYHFRLRSVVRRDIARLNLSQNGLARKLGLSSGFLSQLLNGKRFAGPETRRKIMDALPGLAFDDVFEEAALGDD